MSSEARALNGFLQRYLEDQTSGIRRKLVDYQALYPGHEELIAARYAEYERGSAATGGQAAFNASDRIGPYRLVRELGRGGQGVVYLAEDDRLRRNVALKVLTGLGSLTPDRVARFVREAEVASRLDHPGIATIYEIGTHAGVPYIAMRHVEGETLSGRVERVKATGRVGWPVTEIAQVVEKVARALHAAHEAGVIHRDVKPGNILIPASGDPVVVDFGLAHDADGSFATITKSGEFFGTPAYMSPEQITTKRSAPDRRTDVWSLGATLYECLALERPFEAPTREHLYSAILSREPRDVRYVNRAVSEDLAAIVETALQKEVDRRYQTAGAMADDLEAFLRGRPVAARRVGPVGGLLRWGRREPMKAALILVALILLPAVAALVTDHIANREKVEAARLVQLQEDKDEMLSQGSYQLGEGGYDRAISCFERARSMEGGSPEAVAGLALAHLRHQRPGAALDTLIANSDAVQGLRSAVRLRASALAALGRQGEADSLERGAPPARGPVDYHIEGERLLEEGHGGKPAAFREALASFRMAIYCATRPRAVYFQGAAHAASHLDDHETAREMAQALRRHWPNSASCAFWSGFALASASADEAIAAYSKAIELRPEYADAHTNLGVLFIRKNRIDHAIVSLRAAVRLEPTLFDAQYGLASALWRKGLLDESIASYREALRLRPGDAGAHNNLGVVLRDKALLDEATSSFRDAIRLKPGYGTAHYNLGVALEQKGLLDEAIPSYREAVRLQPDMVDAQRNLCAALQAKGLVDEAVASGREAVRLIPGAAVLHYSLGMALERVGRLDEAIAAQRVAIGLDPKYARAFSALGFALGRKGLLDDAIAAYRTAVTLNPDDVSTRYNLGVALDAKGLYDDAVSSYGEAIRIRPDYAEAHCNMGVSLARTGRLREGHEAARKGHDLGSRRTNWNYPSAQWVKEISDLVRDEQRMLEIAAGKSRASGTTDTLALADLAFLTRRWQLAAYWYEAVLDADGGLEDAATSRRVQAARAAIQAASGGVTESRQSSATDRRRLRRRALEWLTRELMNHREGIEEGGDGADRLRRDLRGWLTDPLLAPVRESASRSQLHADEAQAWTTFWSLVTESLDTH